jgi:hypothetical protein
VELTVLPAGIDRRGQLRKEPFVEPAADEGGIEDARVHAREVRFQSGRDHLPGERGSRHAPDRKQRLQPGAGELRLAIAPHVLQEQIAEGDVGEAICHQRAHGVSHSRFIVHIGAGVRNRYTAERQAGRMRLCLQHIAPHGMHRDAIDRLVQGRQQRLHGAGMRVRQHLQRPGAVLAGTPREDDLHFAVNTSG